MDKISLSANIHSESTQKLNCVDFGPSAVVLLGTLVLELSQELQLFGVRAVLPFAHAFSQFFDLFFLLALLS